MTAVRVISHYSGIITVIDPETGVAMEYCDLLCALPRNDLSREARNGKVMGRTPTFDRD